jgi:hypothetical protein
MTAPRRTVIRRPKKVEEILDDLDFKNELQEEADERAAAARAEAARADAALADAAVVAPPPPPKPTKEPPVKTTAKDEAGEQAPLAALLTANGASHAPDDTDEDDEDLDDEDDDDLDDDDDDLDDDDDDDDDLDEDDDDDDDDDEDLDDEPPPARKPRAKKAPAKKAPAKRPSPVAAAVRGRPPFAGFAARDMAMEPTPAPSMRLPPKMQQERIAQNLNEYDDMLASIDFDASKNHKILLLRVKPEWDITTGRRLAGYLEEFRRPVTPEEIRAKYGGGEYQLTIQGPSAPDGSGRLTFKRTKNIEISGDPIIPNSPKSVTQQKAAEEATQLALVKQVMESKEKDTQRLWAEQQEMKKLLLQTMSRNEGSGDGLRREIVEERRLQEERIRAEREERQRELDRITAERRRELELAQAQHEKQLEIMRMQNEKQIEMMRMEQARIMEEMKQRTLVESSSSRDLLLFMQKMESEKAAMQQKQQEIFLLQQQKQQELATQQAAKQQEFLLQQQMQGQQMLLAQLTATQQTKEQFLMEMLKESRSKKDDFFSTMEKMQQFKQMMATMNGEGEGDGKERWEKILDRVGEAAPGIVAVATSFLQSRAQAQGGQPPAPQAPQRVMPGSVAVAEIDLPAPTPQLPPARKPKPKPASAAPLVREKKPRPPERAPAPQAPPVSTSAVLEATQAPQEGANTLTDFTLPPEGMGIADAIPLLVQNIDLAIQRNMSAEQIYSEVVSKFPIEVLTVLKLASAEQMIEILEQRAPASWIINSLVGTQKIEALHELLVAG